MTHARFHLITGQLLVLSLIAACQVEDSSPSGNGGHTTRSDANANSGGIAASNGGTGPSVGVGGTSATFGSSTSGGKWSTGGSVATGGSSASGGSSAKGGADATSICDGSTLVWKTANKTNYTSYPEPNSEECIKYNGCTWAGQFAACEEKKPEAWVASHSIVAAFPNFAGLELHDLCLRKGDKTLVVTVLDTCGDSDCDGCCTENLGSADLLIDIESYTNERWGVPDGAIEWADLGPSTGQGCN